MNMQFLICFRVTTPQAIASISCPLRLWVNNQSTEQPIITPHRPPITLSHVLCLLPIYLQPIRTRWATQPAVVAQSPEGNNPCLSTQPQGPPAGAALPGVPIQTHPTNPIQGHIIIITPRPLPVAVVTVVRRAEEAQRTIHLVLRAEAASRKTTKFPANSEKLSKNESPARAPPTTCRTSIRIGAGSRTPF